jgi:putative redox protein
VEPVDDGWRPYLRRLIMDEITVIHRADDAFAVLVRDHMVKVDQPYSGGGMDDGPTPVELFVAGLAACAAHYGRRYLAAHGLPSDGVEVRARFAMGTGSPARVARIDLDVRSPIRLREPHGSGFRAAVEHCTVHNSLLTPPRINIKTEADQQAA